ncbi:HpcH/HpaI aldolase family protein [Paracoccus thiocyanatus]|uniref:Siderophore biosynthesis protein SbnG n=1 Tax=Paracoccus thiocyanatus TaxID=34006 RepID=A0A3D8PCB2_9RHOB|nr:aldolase/citrate lyase family protein [Paracoccus thiocyanatus]RDW12901.1 siderophore biosynthesis protein SbnG [Paracoccus thiocyanatus]
MMIGTQRLRAKLEAAEPVLGMMINFDSLWFVDMLALSGFDFIMLDGEHGVLNPAQCEIMLRAAHSGGLSVLARAPNDPHEIQRFLDMGTEGVFVPHVQSVQDAQAAGAAMKYPPLGSRGLTTITRAANYGIDIHPRDFVAATNAQIICGAMVETVAGVEQIDAIAASPAVDAILIGSGDLAASMGLPGERKHPDVLAASRKVTERARAHGKWIAHAASDAQGARQAFAEGAHMVIAPAMAMVVGAGRGFVSHAKDI